DDPPSICGEDGPVQTGTTGATPMTNHPLKRSLAAALAVSLAAPLAPAPVAAAAPAQARDGVVSPDNCRAVGIELAPARPDYRASRVAPSGGAHPAPMPPPPPPPP